MLKQLNRENDEQKNRILEQNSMQQTLCFRYLSHLVGDGLSETMRVNKALQLVVKSFNLTGVYCQFHSKLCPNCHTLPE